LVIEHPQWIPQEWLERLDVRAGADKGRIWRVSPNGTPFRAAPNLRAMSLTELVAALDTPNRWQRDMAQQLLIERDRDAMVTTVELGAGITALEALARSSAHPEVRLQALWTLRTLHQSRAEPLVAALKDPHPGVRSNAIRLLEPFAKTDPELVRALYNISNDADPWVQGQLLATAGELTGEDARRMLVDLLIPTDDVDLRTLGLSSLTAEHLPPVLFFTTFMNPELETMGHPLLEPLVRQTVAMEDVASLVSLGQLLLSDPPAETNPWRWSLARGWVDSVRRRNEPWSTWQDRVTQASPELGRLWATWLGGLPAIIGSPDVDPDRRAEALRLYGHTTPNAAWDVDWLKPSQPLLVQRAAVELAGSLGSSAPAKAIVIGWRKLSPALRDAARQHLLGRPAIAQALLHEVELTHLMPADIDPQTAQFLRTHRDADVRRQAEDALPDADDSQRAALVAETLRNMPETGDATSGRELFAKRCAQCHKLDGLGHAVGPDLAALTDKSVTALVTAVLDPNRAVEAKFLQYGAETTSGQVHTGLLTGESATSLTLLAAEAKAVTLLRSELEDLWSVNKSLMPEGLEKELSPADLANLVTFIRGQVPLPTRKVFPGNEPRRVTVDADGSLLLTPATAEIYGPTIVLEAAHGNLGWWSSADDFAQWTVDVPASGRYRVELEYACHPDAAGHRFLLQSRGGRVSYEVEPTADWETYVTKPIGELDLSAGLQPLIVKPAERPLPALLDLKSVRMVPVE
jgi:putative heme-binding domain-containing protein